MLDVSTNSPIGGVDRCREWLVTAQAIWKNINARQIWSSMTYDHLTR